MFLKISIALSEVDYSKDSRDKQGVRAAIVIRQSISFICRALSTGSFACLWRSAPLPGTVSKNKDIDSRL